MAKPPEPIVMALVRRRQELGLTQRQVAERLGIGTGHSLICRWETGETRPGVDSARRWAEALGLRLTLAVPRGEVPRG